MDPKEVEIPGNSDPNQPGGRISHLALDIGGDSFDSRCFLLVPQSLFNSILLNFLFIRVIVCIYLFDSRNSILFHMV